MTERIYCGWDDGRSAACDPITIDSEIAGSHHARTLTNGALARQAIADAMVGAGVITIWS